MRRKIWEFQRLQLTFTAVLYVYLSRKAEGFGPLKPWQPAIRAYCEGANSSPVIIPGKISQIKASAGIAGAHPANHQLLI
jgi:hypothetical protein